MWFNEEWDDEFVDEKSYAELLRENYKLKQQLKELEAFRDRMVNATTNVTNEWVKAIVSGDVKFK